MASDDINIQTSDNKRSSSSFGEHHDFFNGIYKLLLNFVNTMASFDVLLVTFAFLLSFGNILRKDPYMSGTFQIPVHSKRSTQPPPIERLHTLFRRRPQLDLANFFYSAATCDDVDNKSAGRIANHVLFKKAIEEVK
ncbi:unnamed protein product [Rotaria magnacalcarata]|uniref:Uncharacterized protein n=1 Tax=Rotaria magnacalcarata TaxID=392030 RepID=A0A816MSQ5_9BILA|nr:unnamed protein product [Rotaria magnacalcarata]